MDRRITLERIDALAEASPSCEVACILTALALHAEEGHDENMLSVDATIASLLIAIQALAATQDAAWRRGAIETVASIARAGASDAPPAWMQRTNQ